MILHHFSPVEKRFSRIRSCKRRAEKIIALKNPLPVNLLCDSHPLKIQWENAKLALAQNPRTPETILENLIVLDWMALKVEEFSEGHLLIDDPVVSHVLADWLTYLPLDPEPLK